MIHNTTYTVGERVAVFDRREPPFIGVVLKVTEKKGEITVKRTTAGHPADGKVYRFTNSGREMGYSDSYNYGRWLVDREEMMDRYNKELEYHFAKEWRTSFVSSVQTILNEVSAIPMPGERDLAINNLRELADRLAGVAAAKPPKLQSLDELFADYEAELESKP